VDSPLIGTHHLAEPTAEMILNSALRITTGMLAQPTVGAYRRPGSRSSPFLGTLPSSLSGVCATRFGCRPRQPLAVRPVAGDPMPIPWVREYFAEVRRNANDLYCQPGAHGQQHE
jgi:hypothetical protein